jgi:D-tyrosyl-tRNA(Tyr) deacylase
MRALVQRVTEARVSVGDEVVGEIGEGLCALVGVTHADTLDTAAKLASKTANLRVFDDAAGAMNRSLLETGGRVLVVSQFTLYGDTRRGRRPGWSGGARPEHAAAVVEA